MNDAAISQEDLHAAEMKQDLEEELQYEPIIVHQLFDSHKVVRVGSTRGGHGGGDSRLQDKLFRNPDTPDPLRHTAGVRDGAMSILIGVAARKSIESGQPVRIAELTDLEPRRRRM
jgi:hypothetical protein